MADVMVSGDVLGAAESGCAGGAVGAVTHGPTP